MSISIEFFLKPKGIAIEWNNDIENVQRFTSDGTAFYSNGDQISAVHIAPNRKEIISPINSENVAQIKQVAELAASSTFIKTNAPSRSSNCPALTSVLHCNKEDFMALYFEVLDPNATGEEKLIDHIVFEKIDDHLTIGVIAETNELYCLLIEHQFSTQLFPS
jgi:hypothetical protein